MKIFPKLFGLRRFLGRGHPRPEFFRTGLVETETFGQKWFLIEGWWDGIGDN
jgi:hypothetical protein